MSGIGTLRVNNHQANAAWKVSQYGVFSGLYFPAFGLNTGQYGPEKTPNLDTFYAVKIYLRKESWKWRKREKISLEIILNSILVLSEIMKKKRKKRRTIWTKDWLKRREEKGAYNVISDCHRIYSNFLITRHSKLLRQLVGFRYEKKNIETFHKIVKSLVTVLC